MTRHYTLTSLLRCNPPMDFASVGVVCPGAAIYGGRTAGGGAP